MRYHLRTLLIALALGPPLLYWWAWVPYRNYLERERVTASILRLPIPDGYFPYATAEEKEAWARKLASDWQKRRQFKQSK